MSRGVADGAIRSDVDELATRSRRGKKRHIIVDQCSIASRTLRKFFEVAACAGTLGSNDERPVPSVDVFAVENCILRCMKGDGKVALCSYEAGEAHDLREKGEDVHVVHVFVSFECELQTKRSFSF